MSDTNKGGEEQPSEAVQVEGPAPPSRGAQVRLTGEARDAARGGVSQTLEGNTLAKEALEADGSVADGLSPDGSTRTGKPAADPVVTEQGQPSGQEPAAAGSTRVESTDPAQEGPQEAPKQEPPPPAPVER